MYGSSGVDQRKRDEEIIRERVVRDRVNRDSKSYEIVGGGR